MAIVKVPADISPGDVLCIICENAIPLTQATAGFLSIDNQQAFACNSHFRSGQQFIVGWVDFIITERLKHLQHGACGNCADEGGPDIGWAIC